MERKKIAGAILFFAEPDRDAAGLIGRAAEEGLRLVRNHWGLAPNGDLRVYVMNSWPDFLFHSTPWSWRILLALTFPFWARRIGRLWQVAGGWTQRYGRRLAVGVKPPRLLLSAERSLGQRVFLPEENVEEKIRHISCHEVTHSCTARLKLPAWLNEGLAMVTVDLLVGKPTVRPETVAALAATPSSSYRRKYPAFSAKAPEEFIRYFVLGYWRVRFLEETRPGLLRKLLAKGRRPGNWLLEIAAACELEPGSAGADLDRAALEHFQEKATAKSNREKTSL